MADLISQRIAGNWVTIDKGAHLKRVIDATGPDVIKYEDRFLNSGLSAVDAPLGWTITLVEAGAGESTITKPDGVDGGILLTTDAADNDGISMQLKGESFKLNTSCKALYFYAKLRSNEATQDDFLVGLCITDTTLLGGMTDGIYFRKVDASTSVAAVTNKNSTETQTTGVLTFAANTDYALEFYYDGTSVEFFVDGVSVAQHITNIVDDEDLTPSLEYLTGEAVAHTLTLKHLRTIQVGY